MNRFVLTLMLAMAVITGCAQVSKNSDMPQKAKVWLNNGRTVRGTVTDFKAGVSVTLAGGDSVHTTYDWSDIKKIKRVRGYSFNSFTSRFESYNTWQRGFHAMAELSTFWTHLYFVSLAGI